jgi:hypothetical protein
LLGLYLQIVFNFFQFRGIIKFFSISSILTEKCKPNNVNLVEPHSNPHLTHWIYFVFPIHSTGYATHITNPVTRHQEGEACEDCDYDTLNISVIICDTDIYTLTVDQVLKLTVAYQLYQINCTIMWLYINEMLQ